MTCREGREHGGSVSRSGTKVLRLVCDAAALHSNQKSGERFMLGGGPMMRAEAGFQGFADSGFNIPVVTFCVLTIVSAAATAVLER